MSGHRPIATFSWVWDLSSRRRCASCSTGASSAGWKAIAIAGAIAIEAGILLSMAYEYRNSLWMPIGIHLGWNFVEGGVFGAHFDSVFRIASTGPSLWTGGAFGLEASLQAVILDAAAGAIFAVAIRSARRSP